MKTYLVGGAVRDRLLGRTPKERDWVVVGASPADMRKRGYRQVGRDFPVFLHPDTGEQHALARTERSTGPGHVDFACRADSGVSLEQDLRRRDLTINAIAWDGTNYVDPCGGRKDLEARVLRHVSPAFRDDPLRVFRVARFAAELPQFVVCEETVALMAAMVPELAGLSGERVWQELHKAAAAPCPARFFDVARALGGAHWFRGLELDRTVSLYRERQFPDGGTAIVALGWVHDAQPLRSLLAALRAPTLIRRGSALLAAHGTTLTARPLDAEAFVDALGAIQAFRPGRLPALVINAATGCTNTPAAPLHRLLDQLRAVRVDIAPGPGYGVALRRARIETVRRWQRLNG